MVDIWNRYKHHAERHLNRHLNKAEKVTGLMQMGLAEMSDQVDMDVVDQSACFCSVSITTLITEII